jgi:putative PEP-CTERM system histidine kinase
MLSAAQRARVRVFLNKHFFRYRYDYRVEWLRFTAILSSRATPQEVNLQVVRGLADLVESTSGSLWFKSHGDHEYVQAASWNMPRLTEEEPPESDFSRQMRENEWIVDFTAPAGAGAVQAPPWLAAAGPTWLAIPLLVGSDMPGFVLLGPPRTAIELNWEVRDLLKTAARQAAGFLALMHATEALIETRKFDAFNRMSAFVVHDLKNIITQLSLMLKNAERHRANPEFQQDMLMTVANSLEKMKQMMLQLREGEKPEGVSVGVELVPILQRLRHSALRRGREVALDISDQLATRGHEQRLERVIGHVVQNALDATTAEGTVSVRLERSGGRAAVVVSDTGAGMSPEFVRTRLFRPFTSTKSHGMGIGLYESLQYLKQLGGGVDVVSDEGQGTRVTLLMPLFDQPANSDLVVRDRADSLPPH